MKDVINYNNIKWKDAIRSKPSSSDEVVMARLSNGKVVKHARYSFEEFSWWQVGNQNAPELPLRNVVAFYQY